jgi:MFS family permease
MALSFNYWVLLVAVLLLQFSSNISHGAVQGLIPDLVPERQRGLASAVKAIFELLPLILLGFTIAALVGAGQFGWAVAATGGSLSLIMLLTILLVRETPLKEKPDVPLAPTMLRVLGMLAGIAAGAVTGMLAGGILGGLAGLAVRPFADQKFALNFGVALGGVTAMAIAVLAGVWAGTLTTIGKEAMHKPSFTWWVVNRLMFFSAITSIQGFAPYFMMYAFDVSRETAVGMTGTLMTVVGAFTLLSALPSGWLSDRFGQKRLISLSGYLAATGTVIVLFTIRLPDIKLIYIAGSILGLATGLFTTTNWALGTRLVPPKEAGRYLGLSNLAGAGAGMVGSGIGGPIADYLNASLPGLGYFVIFAGYGVLFLLSSASLLGVSDGR